VIYCCPEPDFVFFEPTNVSSSSNSPTTCGPSPLWYRLWSIGIWEQFSDLFDPGYYRRVMNSFDPFDSSKAHTVDIHFKTFSFHFVAVAFICLITLNKLAIAINTNMILRDTPLGGFTDLKEVSRVFTSSLSVFPNMSRVTFRTLHKYLDYVHPSIMQRPIWVYILYTRFLR
jgi:hypothetical protein